MTASEDGTCDFAAIGLPPVFTLSEARLGTSDGQTTPQTTPLARS